MGWLPWELWQRALSETEIPLRTTRPGHRLPGTSAGHHLRASACRAPCPSHAITATPRVQLHCCSARHACCPRYAPPPSVPPLSKPPPVPEPMVASTSCFMSSRIFCSLRLFSSKLYMASAAFSSAE